MVELGAFLFNKFGKSTDLSKLQLQACSNENDTSEEVLSEEVKVVICENTNFFDQLMSACARNHIIKLSSSLTKQKTKFENKFIFRKLLNSVLEDKIWAENDTENLIKIYKKKFEACKSKQLSFLVFFYL